MVSAYAQRSVDQFIGLGTNGRGETAARFRVAVSMQQFCATPEAMERPSLTLRELDDAITRQTVGAGLSGERREAQLEQYVLAMAALRR